MEIFHSKRHNARIIKYIKHDKKFFTITDILYRL